MNKKFIFIAMGKAFDLNTFEIDEREFLRKEVDIFFKSKQEFITAIDKVIIDFMTGVNELNEEGCPVLSVSYRDHSVNIPFYDVQDNSYSVSTNIRNIRGAIMELVRQTERTLTAQIKAFENQYNQLDEAMK